jgi:hypothetical protein
MDSFRHGNKLKTAHNQTKNKGNINHELPRGSYRKKTCREKEEDKNGFEK